MRFMVMVVISVIAGGVVSDCYLIPMESPSKGDDGVKLVLRCWRYKNINITFIWFLRSHFRATMEWFLQFLTWWLAESFAIGHRWIPGIIDDTGSSPNGNKSCNSGSYRSWLICIRLLVNSCVLLSDIMCETRHHVYAKKGAGRPLCSQDWE